MVIATKFTPDVFEEITERLHSLKNKTDLFNEIVNLPFEYRVQTTHLFLGIIVLLLVNKKKQVIERIALTKNELAEGTIEMSVKPFKEITIPVGFRKNIISKAIADNKPYMTTDWKYLFAPDLTPTQARLNQAGGAIGYSWVYPIEDIKDGGALIFSYFGFPEEDQTEQKNFMAKYSNIVSESFKYFR